VKQLTDAFRQDLQAVSYRDGWNETSYLQFYFSSDSMDEIGTDVYAFDANYTNTIAALAEILEDKEEGALVYE
jgi:hypothetical protein